MIEILLLGRLEDRYLPPWWCNNRNQALLVSRRSRKWYWSPFEIAWDWVSSPNLNDYRAYWSRLIGCRSNPDRKEKSDEIGSKNFEKFWKFLFSPPPLYLSFHEVWGRGRRVLRNCDDWVRRCVRLTVKSTLFPLYSSIANVPTTRDWSESWWHARDMQRYLFCISILFMPFHGHFVSQALLLFDL